MTMVYSVSMLIIILAILLIGFVIWAITRGSKANNGSSQGRSRYAETRSFMDFDPGRDAGKVGDPRYPNAGSDSVMKHEFLEDVLDDGRK